MYVISIQSLDNSEDKMKEKLAKSPKLKLALAIAVPVLVMVVTIVMIGASFAWFSTSPDVYVDTISFSTVEAFRLTFNASDGDNIKYRGQTAITSDGYLITPTWAGTNSYDDKPYCFASRVAINSNGRTADISLALDGADIYKTEEGGSITNMNSYVSQTAKLPYAFTWFFREAGDSGATPQNYVGADKETGTMMDYAPTGSDVWYTPYGKLEFDATGTLTTVNGIALTSLDELTQSERNIEGFTTGDSAKEYDFYVVFAPQKLFFSEIFKKDKALLSTADVVYADNADAISHMYGTSNTAERQGMYYSKHEYEQSMFSFSAVLNVVKLVEAEEV